MLVANDGALDGRTDPIWILHGKDPQSVLCGLRGQLVLVAALAGWGPARPSRSRPEW
jgi:hypothetical protein